jgi:hypothetical protein
MIVMNNSPGGQKSQWWRWPLLPFAVVAGALAGAFALTVVQWLGMKWQGGYSEDGWYYRYVLPVVSSAFFGWLYALIALNVAPNAKILASVVMTTILGVISAIGLLSVWSDHRKSLAEAIQSTIGSIASLTAAIVTIVSSRDDYTE